MTIKMTFKLCVLILGLTCCRCAAQIPGLESQSVFYGLVLTASKSLVNGSLCEKQLTQVEEGVRNKERWALKLLDASGAPRTGMYWGNTFWMGSKKQCIKSMVSKSPMLDPTLERFTAESKETIPPFPVDYYAAYFYHNSTFQIFINWYNETKITLGLCLPSSCTDDQVFDYLQKFFDSGALLQQQLFNMTLTMDGVQKTRDDFSWTHHPISIILVLSTIIIAILVTAGSLYYIWIQREKAKNDHNLTENKKEKLSVENNNVSKNNETGDRNGQEIQKTCPAIIEGTTDNRERLKEMLLCFSLQINFNQVFTLKTSPGTLLPFAGFRMAMTCFIIFSHTYLFAMDYCDNKVNGYYHTETLTRQIFLNSSFSVDVFFFMGGFLMVYTLLQPREMKKEIYQTHSNLTQQYLKGVFKRFKRLTPVSVYILALVFTVTSYRRNSTPFWTNEENDIQCHKYWWTNLLYINNIYPGTYNTMCMSWTYYSSCDMQFFTVCSLLLYLSKRYFKTAVALTIGIFVSSMAIIGVMTYIDNYRPFNNNFYIKAPTFYYPPWARIGPYIIGAALGYYYKVTNGVTYLRKIYVYILWVLSLSLMSYIFFGFEDRNLPLYGSVMYTAFSRNLFTISIAWMTYACLTGHGGLLNTILSLKVWVPLSQLTFTAYLLNPLVVYYVITGLENPWQLEDNNIFIFGNGLILGTYMVSIIIVLAIELPIDKFINILMNEKSSKHAKDNSNRNGDKTSVDDGNCYKGDDGKQTLSSIKRKQSKPEGAICSRPE